MPEIIRAGGFLMYPLLLCSIIGLAFIIERFLTYRKAHCNMETFFGQFENAIKMGKMDEAGKLCEKSQALIPKVLLVGIKFKDESIDDIRQILVDEIQIHVFTHLQKNLGLLSVIAKVSPMIGLLGTVVGLIQMFTNVGFGNADGMAEGIKVALITTAAGLSISIPIIFAHAYFKGIIRNFELELYQYMSKFLRIMRKRKEARAQ